MRRSMQRALDLNRRISLGEAAQLWSLSDVIYIGPTGPAARSLPEFKSFRQIADNTDITEEPIFGLLHHESPTVAGYALELLIRRGSLRLDEAATLLSDRLGEVSMGLGCLVCFQPLGAYARNRIREQNKTLHPTAGNAPV